MNLFTRFRGTVGHAYPLVVVIPGAAYQRTFRQEMVYPCANAGHHPGLVVCSRGVTNIFPLTGFGIAARGRITPLTRRSTPGIILPPAAYQSPGPVPHPPPTLYVPCPEKSTRH